MKRATPSGRPAHRFDYNPIDQETDYDPPALDASNWATQYEYNLDKDVELITRPDGLTIDLEYDSAGRLSRTITPHGTLRYAYLPTSGQLATITATDGGTLNYSYDGALVKQERWEGAVSGTVGFSYDSNFWVSALTVNGAAVNFAYDKDGLLTKAGDLTLTRNLQNGLLTATTLDSIHTASTYNAFGEPITDTASYGASSLYNVSYVRDNLGRISSKTEVVESVTTQTDYAYDAVGRLAEVKEDGVVVASYEYDANSNRIGGFNRQGTITASYDDQDRLTNFNGTSFTYTGNGELLSKNDAGAISQYEYDVLGNLRKVTLADGTVIEYLIDGRNRRIGKKVNGTLVQGFLYQDQLNPVVELDGAGNIVARFVYGSKSNSPDYIIKGTTRYRIVSDHLGSPRLVVNTITGEIVQHLDYDEFGNALVDTNPGFQPFGFAGGIYDQHTKLTRFGARDYDASTGVNAN